MRLHARPQSENNRILERVKKQTNTTEFECKGGGGTKRQVLPIVLEVVLKFKRFEFQKILKIDEM